MGTHLTRDHPKETHPSTLLRELDKWFLHHPLIPRVLKTPQSLAFPEDPFPDRRHFQAHQLKILTDITMDIISEKNLLIIPYVMLDLTHPLAFQTTQLHATQEVVTQKLILVNQRHLILGVSKTTLFHVLITCHRSLL